MIVSLQNWILRDEGTNMDGSIFKAVFVPYAVNLALDDDTSDFVKKRIKLFCWTNAEALWKTWIEENILAMYCNYYWGSMFPSNEIASMGAQASGSSLMEGAARMMVTSEK